MSTKTVLIIGAGVSGLALAQGLSKHNVPFQVYERDTSLTARAQGYRFRISDEAILALRQNLATQHFEKLEHSCAVVTGSSSNVPNAVLSATSGASVRGLFQPGQKIPLDTQAKPWSVDRSVLRKVLMEGIEDCIHFEKSFESYRETDDGVVVRFTDGSKAHGLLLVGADGSLSRVRQQLLPEYRLLDTEGRLLFGQTDMTDVFMAHFSAEAAKALTLIRGPEVSCLLEPMRFPEDAAHVPADYVYWVLFLRSDNAELGLQDTTYLETQEATKLAQSLTSNWHPCFRCLFDDANEGQTSVFRVVSAHPPLPSWEHSLAPVTLVGDAIHPMSPTAALGATSALHDSGELVRVLAQRGLGNGIEGLRSCEEATRKFAGQALGRSLLGGKAVFGMRPFDELPKIELR